MRYENHTMTSIRLIEGDIRDASEAYVLIGRDPNLSTHYERKNGCSFKPCSSWLSSFPVQQCSNSDLSVLRTKIRPSESSRNRQKQITRLRTAIEIPLVHAFHEAKEVALVPISCRAENVVATAMIRMLWDISVAAFLNTGPSMPTLKPSQFSIYCTTSLQPFVDVLESGHYASINHGWLFNTAVQCDRSKRARYLKRRRFKFFRAASE